MKKNFDKPIKYIYANGYPTPEQKEIFTERFVQAFGYARKDKDKTQQAAKNTKGT